MTPTEKIIDSPLHLAELKLLALAESLQQPGQIRIIHEVVLLLRKASKRAREVRG